jgi:uncharacterized damage-inducible protein DinB
MIASFPACPRGTKEAILTNREFFLQMSAAEYPRFVGVLQATPPGQLEYRPHPRSRSAYELISHLIGHEADLVELVETGTINHRIHVPFKSMEEAVQIYSDAHGVVTPALEALSESDWDAPAQFLVQGNLIMQASRRDLAWMLLLDAVHHRGQLSTYLRPMGGSVPSIYGPSADTMPARA